MSTVKSNTLEQIMLYENGEMDRDQLTVFFQHLIDTGLAWQLQGSYGRMAHSLILQGLCNNGTSKR